MYVGNILNELTEAGILQRPITLHDITGAPMFSWEDVAFIWFKVEVLMLRGIERLFTQKEATVKTYDVIIRTPPNDIVVLPSWRIVWTTNNNKIFVINVVSKMNKNYLKLECEEVIE